MKKVLIAAMLSMAMGALPLLAQEKKGTPMKESTPMKSEGMQGGGMMMGRLKDMQGKMEEMRKGMGAMLKEKGMMKSEDMRGMGKSMGEMSGLMGDMGQMMSSGKMTPDEMGNMSKMMGDISRMMKQMSDRIRQGAPKAK